MNRFRILQKITGIHYIHHVVYSFGWKLPFIEFGWFRKFGIRKLQHKKMFDVEGCLIKKNYHNCTETGIY